MLLEKISTVDKNMGFHSQVELLSSPSVAVQMCDAEGVTYRLGILISSIGAWE